jgi:hypothetical protein
MAHSNVQETSALVHVHKPSYKPWRRTLLTSGLCSCAETALGNLLGKETDARLGLGIPVSQPETI